MEEVERRLEGIGAGTKDLLSQAKNTVAGPLAEINGLVADLIEVKVEMAPLIDAAWLMLARNWLLALVAAIA